MKKMVGFSLLTAMLLVLLGSGAALSATYYKYADFTSSSSNSVFAGGYDVDSYGNYLYVNRDGRYIDRYTVATATNATTDKDTHPLNIGPDGLSGTADDNVGPMAVRTLTYDTHYDTGVNNSSIGYTTVSEIYATGSGLYFLNERNAISYYDFTAGSVTNNAVTTSTFAPGSPGAYQGLAQLARGSDGTWYASNSQTHTTGGISMGGNIYKYNTSTNQWEFIIDTERTPGGSHLDGIETAFLDVTDDNVDNAQEWLFTSDMTSQYISRYSLAGVFQQRYDYAATARSLEGLGFGANDHFWATGSGHLYEIGGGAFTEVHGGDGTVPEPSTILLLSAGLIGLAFGRKKFQK